MTPKVELLIQDNKSLAVVRELLTIVDSGKFHDNALKHLDSDSSLTHMQKEEVKAHNKFINKFVLPNLRELIIHFRTYQLDEKPIFSLDKIGDKPSSLSTLKDKDLEKIWLSSLPIRDEKELDIEKLTYQALELASLFSIDIILDAVHFLFPHFNEFQKNYIYLIIWQLGSFFLISLNQDLIKKLGEINPVKDNPFILEIRKKMGLFEPQLAEIKSAAISSIAKPIITKNTPPLLFTALVQGALENKERKEKVLEIAHDLKMLTLEFYQQVQLSEFDNCNWQKQKELAPNIVKATHFFNAISNYFVHLILQQPNVEQAGNVLNLVVEIAYKLCSFKKENPDLNQAMVMRSVYSHWVIERLDLYKQLSPANLKRFKALELLATDDDDYHYLREISNGNKGTLQYLGFFLTNLTIKHSVFSKALPPKPAPTPANNTANSSAPTATSNAGTEKPKDIEIVILPYTETENEKPKEMRYKGTFLAQILRIKRHAELNQLNFKTNLREFLTGYVEIDEHELKLQSFEIKKQKRDRVKTAPPSFERKPPSMTLPQSSYSDPNPIPPIAETEEGKPSASPNSPSEPLSLSVITTTFFKQAAKHSSVDTIPPKKQEPSSPGT